MSHHKFCLTVFWAFTILAVCLGLGIAEAAETPAPLPSQSMIIECSYTFRPIKIDGHLNESAWALAKPIQLFNAATGGAANSKTVARVLWDDKYLYISYRAYDKDIWSYVDKRDSLTYNEDCLEAFFKTDTGKEPYYDIEINAIGTVYDAFIQKKYAGGEDGHRWALWNCAGLQVGTFVQGTLNNPNDEDEYWQREMAIPFADLPTLKGKIPQVGDKWKILLGRYDYSVYLAKGEEMSSNVPEVVKSFQEPNHWVTLEFVK